MTTPPRPAPIRIGDRVRATGTLTRDADGAVVVQFAGRGRYGVLHADWTVRVDGLEASGSLVTIEGVWSGGGVIDAVVIAPAPLIDPPPHLGDESRLSDPGGGYPSREDVLRPEVVSAAAALGEDVLLFFVAALMPSGWVGVAAAADPKQVEAVLRPLLGDGLCIVPSPWSREELDEAGRAFDDDRLLSVLRDVGLQIDPAGRVQHTALMLHMTPELHEILQHFPPGLVDVRAWLTRASSG